MLRSLTVSLILLVVCLFFRLEDVLLLEKSELRSKVEREINGWEEICCKVQ